MRISCGLVPSLDVVDHAKLAEDLGYQRAWLYDSPAIYLDVWTSLALVAAQTERIGLGTAVLVPGLRNVVAEAAAIATIEGAAPGRLALGFGTGATARWTFGKRALSLATVAEHMRKLRALLDGEVIDLDGLQVQMDQLPRFAPPRPIRVPFLLSALGPKGQALAHDVADGIMTIGFDAPGYDWSARLVVGTVLDPGETLASERVKASAGPWYAIMAHGAWEASPEAVDGFPSGVEWRAALEAQRPVGERHLAVHEGHATTVTDLDHILVDAAGEGIVGMSWVAEADAMAAKIADAEAAGTTEIIYAPSGPDIERELQAFAAAAKL